MLSCLVLCVVMFLEQSNNGLVRNIVITLVVKEMIIWMHGSPVLCIIKIYISMEVKNCCKVHKKSDCSNINERYLWPMCIVIKGKHFIK